MKQWLIHRWWGLAALAVVLVFVTSVSQRTLLITGTVLGSIVAFGAFTFAGIYAWRSLWKSTPAGRALMYTMICLGLFATQVSSGAWTTLIFEYEQGYPWRLEIRVAIYAAMVVTVIRLIQNLIRIQAGRQ